MGVGGAFDDLAFVIFANVGAVVFVVAVVVVSTFFLDAFVFVTEPFGSVLSFAHCVSDAFNFFALVSVFFTATDFVVCTVFVLSTLDVDAFISGACEFFAFVGAVVMRGAVDVFADVVDAALFVSAVSEVSALLFYAFVLETETFARFTARMVITSVVADALDVITDTFNLVALLLGADGFVAVAVTVVDAGAVDAFMTEAALFWTTEVVAETADLEAFVVFADFALGLVAVFIFCASFLDTFVVFAEMFLVTVGVATTFDFLASVGFLGCTVFFGLFFVKADEGFAVDVGTVVLCATADFNTLGLAVLASVLFSAVVVTLGRFETTTVGRDGKVAVGVSGAFNGNAYIIVTFAFLATV